DEARARIEAALASGRAAERFAAMAAALGGPADLVEQPVRHLAQAPVVRPALPETAGTVSAMDTRAVGLAVMALGGGRRRAGDTIDHAVGLSEIAGLGEPVGPDRPLALIHARDDAAAEAAAKTLRHIVQVADKAPPMVPVVCDRIA
ncbi:MAG: thymidine phosphorylase, partial [Kiloniellales bacterium]